jgi:leucine dehydrogenase
MSHKNAVAGLPHGGGKGVIIADPSQKTEAMFEAFAEAVNNLGGDYITAEDVNTTCDDALIMLRKTNHICGLPQNSGDPSPFTARGVWQGIKATAKVALGRDDLEGVTVAIQGLGKVGYDLARYLHNDGAKLIVGNRSNKAALERAADEFGATVVGTNEILSAECDILAPCALGAILNPNTIPNLRCKAVAGAANNQILDDASGLALKARGIYYAPDFVINGGGVINAAAEVDGPYNKDAVLAKVDNIYNSIEHILTESKKTGEPEGVIATRYAESIIYR